MSKIKTSAIMTGAAVGAVIGGTISFIGKMAKQKTVDEIGSSIIESTILTGEIVGDAASGTTNLVTGAIRKEPEQRKKGRKELKRAGKRVAGNVVHNVSTLAGQSGEVLKGVAAGDRERALEGAKKLGKLVTVGMLTVGAVKLDESQEDENTSKYSAENTGDQASHGSHSHGSQTESSAEASSDETDEQRDEISDK